MNIEACIVTKQKNFPTFIYRYMFNNVIVETSEPLSWARQRAIQKVKSNWFAFIDDDVELNYTWLLNMKLFIANDVGAIQGVLSSKGLGRFDKYLYKYKEYTELKLGKRGCTHNTLIRSSLVKDWLPSYPDPSGHEDFEISQHILKKGYKWLIIPTKKCYHRYSWEKVRKNAIWNMQGWKKSVKPNTFQKIKKIIPLMFAPFIQRNVYMFIYTFYQNFYQIIGILK